MLAWRKNCRTIPIFLGLWVWHFQDAVSTTASSTKKQHIVAPNIWHSGGEVSAIYNTSRFSGHTGFVGISNNRRVLKPCGFIYVDIHVIEKQKNRGYEHDN